MSDPVRPHRQQPTRHCCPWDSPGKNTGVGCHFLLQCMKGKSESEVTQLCPTLSDPMDHSPPGSSVHRIFQARVLEWVPLPFPKAQSTWTTLADKGASIYIGRSWVRCPPKGLVTCSQGSGRHNCIHDSLCLQSLQWASLALNDNKYSYLVIWISSAKEHVL